MTRRLETPTHASTKRWRLRRDPIEGRPPRSRVLSCLGCSSDVDRNAMKKFFSGLASLFVLGASVFAQVPVVLDIELIDFHPAIGVSGEVRATYVIESERDLDGRSWVPRGQLTLDDSWGQWVDPIPVNGAQRVYRAVKVPEVELIPNMVWIEPGTFMMGSPESERRRMNTEGPQTQVTLTRGFWLCKYEVTQREYLELTGENPSLYEDNLEDPVGQVTWNEAVAYCEKLTARERVARRLPVGYQYQLPTEAQWEYACRAGTTTRYSFGDALQCSDWGDYCPEMDAYMVWMGNQFRDDETGGTKPVGERLPNPWGLYDMHGNATEWCFDRFGNYPGGNVTDPTGSSVGSTRVVRSGGVNDAFECRSASRNSGRPDSPWGGDGMRVACVLLP